MVDIEENVGGDEQALVVLDGSGGEHDESTAEKEHSEGDALDFSGSLIGVKRQSFEQMFELYCQHAREVGFSVRKNTQRRNSVGVVTEKYYVCSNEGFKRCTALGSLSTQKPKKMRIGNITRTDCKASKEYTHMHRSHRSITNEKVVGEDMISSATGASDSYQYTATKAADEHLVGHTINDQANFVNRMKMSAIEGGDAQRLIDILYEEGAEDDNFFCRFKLDVDGRLSNVFWRDSMMCEDYQMYGDMVVFDTTYRTNKYNLVCAPFVGLNNHMKNVMFGCAFLRDEKIDTFEWLFEVFKKSMKLKCPVTIFTNQDFAITSSISKVFPDTRHRLCVWHLYQNAISHFGKLKDNKSFNDAFQRCLSGCINEAEFEECWASMISTYGLQDNSWFTCLYDLREKWCTAHNKDYSSGILFSQRSESTDNAIGFRANRSTNLNGFYKFFKRTVQRWRSREEYDEFECSSVIPTSRIALTGMLKHASEVYTLSVFYDFEEEFLKSISTTVNVVCEEMEVKIYDVQNHDALTSHRVNFFAGDNKINCSCRRFEECGLLCCHCLRILDRNSVKQIPSCYIMKRWTKYAKKDLWDKILNSQDQVAGMRDSNPWSHKMAKKFYNLVIKAQGNEETRKMIEDGYESMFGAVEALTTTLYLTEETEVSTSSILDPAQETSKGRKRRMKGHVE
ncbi:hypothetical protein C2S51_034451 [Perilla frutescens var. frutescens]|nr:hypothetical protein C2S51_034451 [Perilla frutescens var. frutescens]